VPLKDPDEVTDFSVDWNRSAASAADGTGYLAAGETVTVSTWSVPTGLSKGTDSKTTTTTTVWLSGGTLGEDYDVVNHITTSQGRQADKTVRVKIRNQ
jgi:hypothetical protein